MRFLSPWFRQSKKTRRPAHGRGSRRSRATAKRHFSRRLAWGLLAGAGLSSAVWLWHSGWVAHGIAAAGDGLLAMTARAGLKVEDVLVEGRARSRRSEILEILGIKRDAPILAFDPHAAKQRLEALPWVGNATVERRLPRVIYLRLVEREPLALWQHEGRLAVIDRSGRVIPGVPAETHARLPLVVGEDAAVHAVEMLAMLASEAELNNRVAALVRVRNRRWNVRLQGGIDVRLPEGDPAGAWAQLARIQREHDVLGRDVVTIDMRMPDRLIVRTAPGAGRTGGENT